jgi:hypothetical protein
MLNKAGRCCDAELGICGRNIIKAAIANDITLVEVSICRHFKRFSKSEVDSS